MPRVYLTETNKLNSKLIAWVYGQMKVNGISQRVLADELQISQQLLNYRLKHKIVSFSDFTTYIRVFKPDTEEVKQLLGIKGE